MRSAERTRIPFLPNREVSGAQAPRDECTKSDDCSHGMEWWLGRGLISLPNAHGSNQKKGLVLELHSFFRQPRRLAATAGPLARRIPPNSVRIKGDEVSFREEVAGVTGSAFRVSSLGGLNLSRFLFSKIAMGEHETGSRRQMPWVHQRSLPSWPNKTYTELVHPFVASQMGVAEGGGLSGDDDG